MDSYMIEDMKRVAIIMARVAACNAEVEGMKAENANRAQRGESMAYTEDNFALVVENHGIGHNSIMGLLQR